MMPSVMVHCPYCGEAIELLVEDSVEQQQYIEDCQVCCRPIVVSAEVEGGEYEHRTGDVRQHVAEQRLARRDPEQARGLLAQLQRD